MCMSENDTTEDYDSFGVFVLSFPLATFTLWNTCIWTRILVTHAHIQPEDLYSAFKCYRSSFYIDGSVSLLLIHLRVMLST